MSLGPIASGVGRGVGRQLGEMDYQEVLGKCMIDKKGNYYTRLPKMIRGMFWTFDILMFLCIVGLIVIGPSEEGSSSQTEIYMILFAVIFLIINNIGWLPIITYRHILTSEGLQKKRIRCNRFLSYDEIYQCSKQWPILLFNGNAIIMGYDKMIKINFMNNAGGADFLIKLGQKANVYINEKEMVDALQKRRHKKTKEEKEAYENRVFFLKQRSL